MLIFFRNEFLTSLSDSQIQESIFVLFFLTKEKNTKCIDACKRVNI